MSSVSSPAHSCQHQTHGRVSQHSSWLLSNWPSHHTVQSVARAAMTSLYRLVRNPEHKPRWKRQRGIKESCCVSTCNDEAHVKSKIATSDKITEILGCKNAPHPTPLCKHHYHLVYDTLQPKTTHCCTCGLSLKNVATRPCPDAQRIQQYLAENTGFKGSIIEGANVCMSCYKSHLQILKKVPLSTDDDLLALINNLKQLIKPIELVKCADDLINRAIYSTAIHVYR